LPLSRVLISKTRAGIPDAEVRGKNKGICGNNETFPMKNQSFLVPNSQHLANELSAIFVASMSLRGKNGYSSLFTIS
jgi:hypothetical protein